MQTNKKIKSYLGFTITAIFVIGVVISLGNSGKLTPPTASARVIADPIVNPVTPVVPNSISNPALIQTLTPTISVNSVTGSCYKIIITKVENGTPAVSPLYTSPTCIPNTAPGSLVPTSAGLVKDVIYQLTAQSCSTTACSAVSSPLYFFKSTSTTPPPQLFTQTESGDILKFNENINSWSVVQKQTSTLKVKIVNTGWATGKVVSSPAGIDCSLPAKAAGSSGYGTNCEFSFPKDATVILTATSTNSVISGFSQGCTSVVTNNPIINPQAVNNNVSIAVVGPAGVKMDTDYGCTVTFKPPANFTYYQSGVFYRSFGAVMYHWDIAKGWIQ